MDYDGEGLGLAWYSGSDFGESVDFMRWAPDGSELTAPTIVSGGTGTYVDIAWTGQTYAIPLLAGDAASIALVTPDGVGSGDPIRLPPGPFGDFYYQTLWSGSQLLVHAGVAGVEQLLRLSPNGVQLGPSTRTREVFPPRIVAVPGGPIAATVLDWAPELGDRQVYLTFRRIGCGQ